LRRYTFTVPPRTVARDTEFFGWPMRKEERVSLLLAGADLDERVFPDAGTFDLDRENKVHIAFGVGPHRCLGSHLARIELQVIYERMLARIPSFRLDPERPPRFHGGPVIGIDTLPLIWTAQE
jgi:cytochrome P450